MKIATFNRFELELPEDCIEQCDHPGACDDDVEHWAKKLQRPDAITPEKLRAELKEYGAWDGEELADDDANWRRIIWLAAGNINEEERAED